MLTVPQVLQVIIPRVISGKKINEVAQAVIVLSERGDLLSGLVRRGDWLELGIRFSPTSSYLMVDQNNALRYDSAVLDQCRIHEGVIFLKFSKTEFTQAFGLVHPGLKTSFAPRIWEQVHVRLQVAGATKQAA